MPLLKKSNEERGFVLPNIRICDALSVMTVWICRRYKQTPEKE